MRTIVRPHVPDEAPVDTLRRLQPAYREADLADLCWCVEELARLEVSLRLTTMTASYVAHLAGSTAPMLTTFVVKPVSFIYRLWTPPLLDLPSEMHLHLTALSAAQAALAEVWTRGHARPALLAARPHVRKVPPPHIIRQIDAFWSSLADEIAENGVPCTVSQARSISWVVETLDDMGYSIQVWVKTLGSFKAQSGGKLPKGVAPAMFDHPPLTYQLWGPRYPNRGAHRSPFSPNVEVAVATALLNLARLDRVDAARKTTVH